MDVGIITWKEPRAPTEHECRHRLEEEGYAVMEWKDPPGATYESHSHDHDECICVVKGSMKFEINNRSYKLNPGDFLYLPKFTLHSAQVSKAVSYLIGHK